MKYGNKANARKVDAPAMSSEASVANNFLRGVISTDSLTKNYRSVQRYSNLLSESMLTNSQSGVNHRYFTVAVGQREIVYATLPSKLKSKCTSVKGKMILSSSSWSITPDFRSIVISRCTALKSRFNRLDSSLIDIEPAPAIVFMIFNRLGASIVLVSDSISWNDIENGTSIASPARAADIAILFFSQDSSWDITCTTNVFMLLPPEHNHVIMKLFQQIMNVSERSGVFIITNMLVIAFACFIIVTHYTDIIYNISQSVFIFMITSSDGRVNYPNNNLIKCIFPLKDLSLSVEQLCRHIDISLCDDNNIITLLMMQTKSSLVDNLNLESYTVLAVAKSTAGIGVPFVIRALNRVSGFFMGEAQLHLLFVVIMVGRAGEPQGSPGSLMTGYANPVRLTTHEIGVSSGELSNLSSEDAIMATIPTQTQPKTPNIYVSDIDLERRTHEINLLLGCASFLACNATQEAKRRLIDMIVLAECRTQELAQLIQQAEFNACTRPARRRVR